MKKILPALLFVFISAALLAKSKPGEGKTGVIYCSDFHVTIPLRDMPAEPELAVHHGEESEDREHRTPQKFRFSVNDGPQYGNDSSIMQTKMGTVPNRAPLTNWTGQTASGFRPFDPSGAAGLTQYVQMINSTTFKVFTKTSGAVLLTKTLGTLWPTATPNDGDPIVLYDKAADRWFLAQFGSTGNSIYIAISTTGDATGSYYTYTFTSPEFPDYLKFSVWTDGYYMTSNQTQKVFAFERTAMLAGNASSRAIYTLFSPPDGGGFFVPLPGDASDGVLPPVGTPCPIFSYSDNGWGASYTDAVNIYQMAVNWVPATPTASITSAGALATSGFDASYNSAWNDVSQPLTAQKLDGIGGVCMYRAQWKSWAGYNSVVLNWAVKISSSQRSIMWAELRQSTSTGIWSIYQQGIYTPDLATRWMGSIAMDDNGSIGLGYIKINTADTTYASLYYTGRRTCDPLGTLPLTESLVIAGTGYQSGTNRVGDYSELVLDPDGTTFWYTGEYMGGSSGSSASRTRIFSFQIPVCGNTAFVNIAQTSGTNPMCPGASATFTATPSNGGTTPVYQWKVNGANVGTNSPTYTTTSLTNGQVVTCVMTSNLPGVTGNPATSNSITMTVNPVVTPSVTIAQTGGSNPSCAGANVIFTATPVNGGTTPSYQWKVNGVNSGSNSATFSTSSLTNGQVVTCVMTSNAPCPSSPTATSNGITMSITSASNPTVSISQTSGTNPMCSGATVVFTATVSNGSSPVYQWKVDGVNAGTNSATFTTSSLSDGQVISCDVTASVTCPNLTVATLGTATTTNSVASTTTSSPGAAYPTYYGNGRQQYILRASELTALGLSAGNLTSIGFNVATSAIGDPVTLSGYTIKITSTATNTATTTFLSPAFTTVFGPVNYTPIVNSINTHTFSSPFPWNGSSNLLIDICLSNQVVGNASYQNYYTTASFVASTFYQADGAGGAGACTQTTGSTTSRRPNMTLTFGSSTATVSSNTIPVTVSSSIVPSVSIALTAGSNPECSGASATFTATPINGGTTPVYQWKIGATNVGTNNAVFTTNTLLNGDVVTCVMTSNSGCASPNPVTSNSITMTVNPNVAPSVSISLSSGTNPECTGASATFTATPTNGGTTPSYQWKIGATNVGTNSPTFTTSTLLNADVVSCVMTSNAACASPNPVTSNTITMTVNPNVTPSVSIALTGGTNPECSGSSATFTATATNGGLTPSYQWKIGATNVGTNSPTFTSATLLNNDVITCVMTSNASCASPNPVTSNSITMTVNPILAPSVSISLSSGTNPECAGSSATFTATPTNGGATPTYQWKIGATNVGTNSPTFTSTTLANGNVVTCVMTSNATCASPNPVTSNSITMTVNPIITPSVSIVLTSGTNPECSGASATFTATPTNGGTTPSYQWKIGATNVGTNSSTFTTTTLANGNVVTCVMTSNAACASPNPVTSNSITMTVNPTITPSVTISLTSGTNPECSGASATFTATPANGGTTPSYQWKIGATNVGTNSTTFTSTTLANGNVVTCVMTSNATCASPNPVTSNSITMTVNPILAPSVSIALSSGTNPECSGASATFTATPTNGGTTPSYQWKIGATNVGTNSSTFTTTTLANGNVVTCVMTSNATCASPNPVTSNSITMTVNSILTPSVLISLSTGTNPECSGASATFTATPTNGGTTPSYQWKIGATNVGTNSSTFTTTTLANGNVVTCVMTSNATCASPNPVTSNSITMTVNSILTPSVLITLTSGTNPECSGASATFTATPTNGGSTPLYQWKIGVTNVGANSPTFTSSTLLNGDGITCVMTSNATCASPNPVTSNSITMTVNPVISPSVSIALTSGTNPECSGSSVTFSATPTNGGSTPSYQWKIGSTNAGTNSTTFTSSTLSDGDVITCIMTSNAACANPNPVTSFGITVSVSPAPFVSSFSPSTGPPGSVVNIFGSGFDDVTGVMFNNVTASSFIINSGGQITATVPVNGNGLITLTSSLCANAVSATPFTISSAMVLNLKIFVEGFYRGSGTMTGIISPSITDTMTVNLADASPPHNILYTSVSTVSTTGDGAFNFNGVPLGISYYIDVLHRNALETWSAVPLNFNSTSMSYDFTNSQTSAFGSNLKNLGGGIFGMYSGDIDQDGDIDVTDLAMLENNTQLFVSGYLVQDLTGDLLIESADYSLLEFNYPLLLGVRKP